MNDHLACTCLRIREKEKQRKQSVKDTKAQLSHSYIQTKTFTGRIPIQCALCDDLHIFTQISGQSFSSLRWVPYQVSNGFSISHDNFMTLNSQIFAFHCLDLKFTLLMTFIGKFDRKKFLYGIFQILNSFLMEYQNRKTVIIVLISRVNWKLGFPQIGESYSCELNIHTLTHVKIRSVNVPINYMNVCLV